MEQGKDIIACDTTGLYHAYQLKQGHLTLPAYREIEPEIIELVEYPLMHPGIPPGAPFVPYLVTNGNLRDPTRLHIIQRNQGWAARGFRPLTVIDRDQLLSIFLETQGDVLPTTPADFAMFFGLYLADSTEPLRKADLATVLASVVAAPESIKKAEIRRVFAAVAVLAGYVLSGFQRQSNHVAAAEGWMLVIARLLSLGESARIYEPAWAPTVQLCEQAWATSVEALAEEALSPASWAARYFGEDIIHGWRVTVTLGYLSALTVYYRMIDSPYPREGDIFTFVTDRLQKREVFYWGESAAPYFFAICQLLSLHGATGMARDLAVNVVSLTARLNGGRVGLGVPDPYYLAEDLLDPTREDELFGEQQTFRGSSFGMRPFVEALARNGWKQTLRRLWPDITRVDYSEYAPDGPTEFYTWRSTKGSLDTRCWGQPQDWTALVAQSNGSAANAPGTLLTERFPQLVVPFFLVHPHRFTAALAHFVEDRLR